MLSGLILFVFATVFGILASAIAAVAVHEAGHLFMGLAAGFRCRVWALGPISISPNGIKWDRNWAPLEYAGLAYLEPKPDAAPWKYALVYAGGPLANLLFSFPLVYLYRALLDRVYAGGSAVVANVAFVALIINTGFGALNLVPKVWRGITTDGARLLLLLRGGGRGQRMISLMQIGAQTHAGQRPREWDAGLIEAATSISDNSPDEMGACVLAYAWCLDSGNVERAGVFLDRARSISSISAMSREALMVEVAYFEARYRKNSNARQLLAPPAGNPLMGVSALRAEAAVLVAEGRIEGAKQIANRALVLVEQDPQIPEGERIVEREWITELVQHHPG